MHNQNGAQLTSKIVLFCVVSQIPYLLTSKFLNYSLLSSAGLRLAILCLKDNRHTMAGGLTMDSHQKKLQHILIKGKNSQTITGKNKGRPTRRRGGVVVGACPQGNMKVKTQCWWSGGASGGAIGEVMVEVVVVCLNGSLCTQAVPEVESVFLRILSPS